ncbi:MAG: hypothetical protein H7Y15_12255 [Pseudonocardia sp.]|nr:hypothetical protein [Pseudonocardia sp.]
MTAAEAADAEAADADAADAAEDREDGDTFWRIPEPDWFRVLAASNSARQKWLDTAYSATPSADIVQSMSARLGGTDVAHTINHNYFGGHAGGSTAAEGVTTVDPALLDAQERLHAGGRGFDSLLSVLGSTHRLILVTGRPGSGRFFGAMMAIHRQHGDVGILHGHEQILGLATAPEATCLLLDVSDDPDSVVVRPDVVQRLHDVLGRLDRRLVVVVGHRPELLTARRAARIVRWLPPALDDVIVRVWRAEHLFDKQVLRSDLDRILRLPVVVTAIAGLEGPAAAADFARALCRALRDEVPPDGSASVIARVEADRRRRARDALSLEMRRRSPLTDDTYSIYRRAFALSCAVFDGMAESTVVAACGDLGRLLSAEAVRGDELPASPLFAATVSEWLDEVGARRTGSRPPTIAFRSADRADLTLDLAWHEHPLVRPLLVRWLTAYAIGDRPDTAERAAQVIGKLATYDFDDLRDDVWDAWSQDADPQARRAAATVLSSAAADDRTRDRVEDLLLTWRESSSIERLHTAAIAHDGILGKANPEGALDCLGLLAQRGWKADRAVPRGLISLVHHGHTDAVVERLAEWSASFHPRLRREAARCLPLLAPYSTDARVFPLLAATASDRRAARSMVRLWRDGLAHSRAAEGRWRMLWDWVVVISTRPDLAPQLDIAVRRLVEGRPEIRERLLYHARVWNHRRPDLGAAVAIVSHALEEGNDVHGAHQSARGRQDAPTEDGVTGPHRSDRHDQTPAVAAP